MPKAGKVKLTKKQLNYLRWYKKAGRQYHMKWKRRTRMFTGIKPKDRIRIGYICELLAVADMNVRCPMAYINPVHQTKDDAFVKTSIGWRSVQIKKGLVYSTGAIALEGKRNSRKFITSEVIAIVDLEGRRIRYTGNKAVLPPELPTKPSPLCGHL